MTCEDGCEVAMRINVTRYFYFNYRRELTAASALTALHVHALWRRPRAWGAARNVSEGP